LASSGSWPTPVGVSNVDGFLVHNREEVSPFANCSPLSPPEAAPSDQNDATHLLAADLAQVVPDELRQGVA